MTSRHNEITLPHRTRIIAACFRLSALVARALVASALVMCISVATASAQDLLRPAKTAIFQGQYSVALARLTSVIDEGQLSGRQLAEAYFYRGGALQRLTRFEDALSDYGHAIGLAPNLAPAYMDRGITYYWLGRYARALADYSRAIVLRPDYDLAYINRGNVLQELDAFDLAKRDYSRAIALNTNAILAYSGRAAAQYRQHQFKPAVGDYNWALSLHRTNSAALWGRAYAMYNLGQPYAAALDFAALAAVPNASLYAALWHHIAILNSRSTAPSRLERAATNADPTLWPYPLAIFFLGRASRQYTLAQAFSVDPEIRRQNLAETYFTFAMSAFFVTGPEASVVDLKRAASLGGSAYADPIVIETHLTRRAN